MKSLIAALVLVATAAAGRARAEESCWPGFEGHVTIVARLEKGPRNRDFEKVAPEHLEYLKQGFATGKLRYAGPTGGRMPPEGALIVIDVATVAEARRLVAGDPLIRHGVFRAAAFTSWLQCRALERVPTP
jgi:uncharacterized protein YciI